MSISRIDHIGITTSDLERSLHFYVDLLGMRLLSRARLAAPEIAQLLGLETVEIDDADLDSGDGRIVELFQYMEPVGARVDHHSWDFPTTHIAFTVSDLAAVRERLAEAAVEVISRHVMVSHETEGPWAGVQCLYVRDPDGVIVELVQRPS